MYQTTEFNDGQPGAMRDHLREIEKRNGHVTTEDAVAFSMAQWEAEKALDTSNVIAEPFED